MSEDVCCKDRYSYLDTQLILLVVSVCFHIFQALVTGMKWRVKCKDRCSCSLRPKGSSPSPPTDTSSSGTSPEKPAELTVIQEK